MTDADFEKLIDKEKYQVFIFTSRCSFPVTFARHPWFIVNKKGVISRWEVIHKTNLNKTSWGYLYRDFLRPLLGIGMFHFQGALKWQGELLAEVEEDENSTARKMGDFIENSPQTFPYCNEYHLFPGPNSDTYVQWVLSNFPELKIKLPWNCFGKNFKK